MLAVAAIVAAFVWGADAGQSPPAKQTLGVPLFSDFPVRELFKGPFAIPKFKSASDKEYVQALLGGRALAPNFAGRFRIVQFRIGRGPIGAILIDSKTGSVLRLPDEIVKGGFFIDRTECLAGLQGLEWARLGDEEDPSAPLSFKTNSALLEVKQCRTAVERRYYRWDGRSWHFLKRVESPPPPVP